MKIFISLLLVAATSAFAEAEKNHAALVNGKPIAMDAVTKQLDNLVKKLEASGKKLDPKIKNEAYMAVLGQMVTMELLLQAAEKEGIENDPQFRNAMKERTNALKIEYFFNKKQEALVKKIAEAKLKQYAEDIAQKENEIALQQMVVSDVSTAERIKKSLERSGKNFTEIAKEYSQDKGEKVNLPVIAESMLPPDIGKAIAGIKVGGVAIIRPGGGSGALILRVANRKKLSNPSQIQKLAYDKVVSEASQEVRREIEAGSKVELFGMDGNPIEKPLPR